jgi:hypothetical protein
VDLFVEMTTVHGLVPDEATMVGFITTAVRDLDGAFGGALISMYGVVAWVHTVASQECMLDSFPPS